MKKVLFITLIYSLFCSNLFATNVQEGFADLVEELIPSVVSIASKTNVNNEPLDPPPQFPEGSPFEEFFKDYFERRQQSPSQRPMYGLGSGFIIDKSGIVVTNNHVIEGADEIKIVMFDNKEFKAKLLGRDPKADLAVLQFDPEDTELTAIKWGNSDESRVGDWTIAIGNPLGLGGTVTAGIVSAISRDIGNGPYVKFIQTDASINRGNSGGPLFNIKGEVIGINSAIISQTGGSIGLGFAIPSNSAKKIVQQLKDFGRTKRGWLGVQITPVSEELAESLGLPNQKGAFISSINLDGPSKKAGIQDGDVILEFNGAVIEKMIDLPRLVAESDVGSTAIVKLWRKDKIIQFKVQLGELPEQSYVIRNNTEEEENEHYINDLSITIKATKDDIGIEVVNVDEDSKLVSGDVITEVNRELISTVESFKNIVRKIKETGRSSLLLKVTRGSESIWVTIKYKN